MASRSEIDMEAALAVLAEAGYVADGLTRSETFRDGSASSPLLGHGKSGGRLVTTGGRIRLALPGSPARATVGKVTTALYERGENGQPAGMRTLPTRDTAQLREALGLGPSHPRP